VPYRGGNWNNGSNAGLFYLNLNNLRSNSNNNIGFRPALLRCQIRIAQGLYDSAGRKGASFLSAEEDKQIQCGE